MALPAQICPIIVFFYNMSSYRFLNIFWWYVQCPAPCCEGQNKNCNYSWDAAAETIWQILTMHQRSREEMLFTALVLDARCFLQNVLLILLLAAESNKQITLWKLLAWCRGLNCNFCLTGLLWWIFNRAWKPLNLPQKGISN